MTNEEKLAEEYTEISLNENEYEECLIDFHDVVILKEAIKKAYLAGLKTGRETEKEYVKNNAFTSMKEQGLFPFGKWHDLRKNPKDLPEPHSTVLDENGDKITYCGGDTWTVYSEYYEKDIDVEPPKAWCEVPKFEE